MSIDITSLRTLPISELVETAHEIGIDNAANLKKQELIFEIVRHKGTAVRAASGEGVLEILPDGFGFLRSQECNYLPGPDDIYVSPSQIFFGTNKFENIKTGDKLVNLLDAVLKKWQGKGYPIGSFVLYFHGHGEQVGWMIYLQYNNIVVFSG